MTGEKLKQRLQQSASELRLIVSSLSSISSPSIHNDCIDKIRKFETMANQLSSICDLISSREQAHKLLKQLPSITDPSTDIIDYHGISIPFNNARILGFQSYLSMTWSLCDSITTAIAPLIFTESICKDRSNPPQLLTHFIKDSKCSSYYITYFLKVNYSWAIGISYVIRNHFVHDGALRNGKDFFVGISLADEFDISSEGWDFLEKQMAEKHRLKNDHHRLGSPWPWHRNNLLNLLEVCNEEIDEALCFIVGSSVGMATLQARYL
jgi:hypothetical protein